MVTGATSYLPLNLAGLRVAITGAAGGIGLAMADGFAACGAAVFVSDVDAPAVAGCAHKAMVADAGDAAAMEGFIDRAVTELGGLDVLINNAGIAGPTKRVEDIEPGELDRVLQIDLSAMFHTCRRAIPALKAAGGGAIVNMSSSAGRFGFPMGAPYAAAKWGVVGLTKSLAMELGPFGIRVNALQPGAVDGPRIRGLIRAKAEAAGISEDEQTAKLTATTSLRCLVSQYDIANMALYLASPFGATISGQTIAIDGDKQYLV